MDPRIEVETEGMSHGCFVVMFVACLNGKSSGLRRCVYLVLAAWKVVRIAYVCVPGFSGTG